jgi:hypothetical protein
MEYRCRKGSAGRRLVSVILIDWTVRESFHSIVYLNDQTLPRDQFELIWVEFYDRRAPEIDEAVENPESRSPVDKWIVLDRTRDTYYHKHEMYNAGLLAAEGEVCIICDSDAVFGRTFLQSVALAFRKSPRVAVHVDEVRNRNRSFHPFRYPSIDEILTTPGLANWTGRTTTGLAATDDRLHQLNYGACMAARHRDLIGIGGADEHLDYLGHICGPHEMTFRLVNKGLHEVWLDHEWLYHTWHPGQAGGQNFGGPHDGRNFSLRTLALRESRQVLPAVENPIVARLREGDHLEIHQRLEELGRLDRRDWTGFERHLTPLDPLELVEENFAGYNIIRDGSRFIALAQGQGPYDPAKLARQEYRRAIVGTSADEVRRRICGDGVEPPREETLPATAGFNKAHAAAANGPRIPTAAPEGTARLHRGAAVSRNGAWAPAPRRDPSDRETQATVPGQPPSPPSRFDIVRRRVRSHLLTELGWDLYNQGAFTDALLHFCEALSCDEGNDWARLGRANARVQLGHPDPALADFDRLLNRQAPLSPRERAEALTGRAWAHHQRGTADAAFADFTEALALVDDRDRVHAGNIRQGRCWAAAGIGRTAEAVDDYLEARRLTGAPIPSLALPRWLLFKANSVRGRIARVRRTWSRLVSRAGAADPGGIPGPNRWTS